MDSLVYKVLPSYRNDIDNSDAILNHILNLLKKTSPRLTVFKTEVLTYISGLRQISKNVNLKCEKRAEGNAEYLMVKVSYGKQ